MPPPLPPLHRRCWLPRSRPLAPAAGSQSPRRTCAPGRPPQPAAAARSTAPLPRCPRQRGTRSPRCAPPRPPPRPPPGPPPWPRAQLPGPEKVRVRLVARGGVRLRQAQAPAHCSAWRESSKQDNKKAKITTQKNSPAEQWPPLRARRSAPPAPQQCPRPRRARQRRSPPENARAPRPACVAGRGGKGEGVAVKHHRVAVCG